MAKSEKSAPPAEADVEKVVSEKAPPEKKSGGLKLIIIVVIAMVVGGAGAFGAMSFLGGGSSEQVEEVVEDEQQDGETDGEKSPIEAPKRDNGDSSSEGAESGSEESEVFMPQFIEFKPFVANLGSSGGKRFLKLTMSAKVETLELSDEVNQKMPQFRDTILLLLSSLSYDDIATMDGKERLRNQVLNRINSQLTTGKIKNVYFSEFVMQ